MAYSRESAREEPVGQGMKPPVGVGTVLNSRFVLEEVIARSGMGVIYRARDLREEEVQEPEPYVAIEVLNADVRQHPDDPLRR